MLQLHAISVWGATSAQTVTDRRKLERGIQFANRTAAAAND